ncbi:MAG: hypothetical protein GWO08_03825 [Gammaproteobacteria bacterium]|nr:hypothetical protein [Gammaproteobacteria bacterium]NIN62266.1 hypothetical protein [Gammaproteobacteria bacterium]NIO62277.1 hypothetical protein [Gammaproteobacteria bacterium]NIP48796.1 hypothetical protein [Gammaproteobacteria bacterium]NIQ09250.1 hypothetical protein [Gammaproteobacteria bacterium]
MTNELDKKERKETLIIFFAIFVLLCVLAGGLVLLLPSVGEILNLQEGLGLKESAIIAFFITIIVMIVFAIAAGDSLIGEIQYMLGGFFSFFLLVWFLIAWVF